MIATDFEFDGEYLRNWGFMICSMDQDGRSEERRRERVFQRV